MTMKWSVLILTASLGAGCAGRSGVSPEARAKTELAVKYGRGDGVPRDPAKAVALLEEAAAANDPGAHLQLGLLKREGRDVPADPKAAAEHFRRAAEMGDARAMNELGLCYLHGTGVGRSPETAFEWFAKSSAAGNAAGTVELAVCHLEGRGTAKDPAKALPLFQQAAGAGNAFALMSLGFMHETGQGVRTDKIKAVEYYEEAAALGDGYSTMKIGRGYMEGTMGLERDDARAFAFLETAHRRGVVQGTHYLAYMHESGRATPRDLKAAIGLYEQAAARGFKPSKRRLAILRGSLPPETLDQSEERP